MINDNLYIVLFLIFLYIGIVIIKHIDKEENGRLDRRELDDKIHKMTKVIRDKIDTEYLLSIIDGLLYIAIGIVIYIYITRDKKYILTRNFLPILLILFYFRILCIWSTSLPSSMRNNKRSYLNPVTVDHMFSSHTMFMISCVIYINLFIPSLFIPSVIFTIIYFFLIIVSKEHYTIDVLISIALTTSVFSNYIILNNC